MPKFYGYTFLEDDSHTGKIPFENVEDAMQWIMFQGKLPLWKRVILTDTGDFIVAEYVDRKATFPKELVELETKRKRPNVAVTTK